MKNHCMPKHLKWLKKCIYVFLFRMYKLLHKMLKAIRPMDNCKKHPLNLFIYQIYIFSSQKIPVFLLQYITAWYYNKATTLHMLVSEDASLNTKTYFFAGVPTPRGRGVFSHLSICWQEAEPPWCWEGRGGRAWHGSMVGSSWAWERKPHCVPWSAASWQCVLHLCDIIHATHEWHCRRRLSGKSSVAQLPLLHSGEASHWTTLPCAQPPPDDTTLCIMTSQAPPPQSWAQDGTSSSLQTCIRFHC